MIANVSSQTELKTNSKNRENRLIYELNINERHWAGQSSEDSCFLSRGVFGRVRSKKRNIPYNSPGSQKGLDYHRELRDKIIQDNRFGAPS